MEPSVKDLVRRVVPSSVRGWLQTPNIWYARRTLDTVGRRVCRAYAAQYSVEHAPFHSELDRFDPLFESSRDRFEQIVAPWVSEFDWSLGRIYNGAFQSVDVELYYSMIRARKPELIIEVGSGHATHFALEALRRNACGRMICVDPQPRRSLPPAVKHIASPVEEVGLDLFSELGSDDLLFIDSSHTTHEALHHCRRILPRLRGGVVVHHHDFTYPWAVYYLEDEQLYGEPDVLLEFYENNRDSFDVLVASSFVRYRDPELIHRLIRSYRWNPCRIPGSLWAVKTGS